VPATIAIIEPATERVLETIHRGGAEDVDAAVARGEGV
jgi:acyl-CoA reductase-like NAD-dependent aldehyde dehydrogenase